MGRPSWSLFQFYGLWIPPPRFSPRRWSERAADSGSCLNIRTLRTRPCSHRVSPSGPETGVKPEFRCSRTWEVPSRWTHFTRLLVFPAVKRRRERMSRWYLVSGKLPLFPPFFGGGGLGPRRGRAAQPSLWSCQGSGGAFKKLPDFFVEQ